MVKSYKQDNEHELTTAIREAKQVYVHAVIGTKTETLEVSKGVAESTLYEIFKDSEAKVKAVHIQDAIYLQPHN